MWITWIFSCITFVLWLFSTCISFPFKKLSTFFGTVTKFQFYTFVQSAHIAISFLLLLTDWKEINKLNFHTISTSSNTSQCPLQSLNRIRMRIPSYLPRNKASACGLSPRARLHQQHKDLSCKVKRRRFLYA